eukprot:11505503-Alexandrium_andersonii.AAC.1
MLGWAGMAMGGGCEALARVWSGLRTTRCGVMCGLVWCGVWGGVWCSVCGVRVRVVRCGAVQCGVV